jgi:hypothetical protein
VNSGLNGQAFIVVKIYEKTSVTIHKEKAGATSPKQCRIGMGQPYQKSLKAAGIPQRRSRTGFTPVSHGIKAIISLIFSQFNIK